MQYMYTDNERSTSLVGFFLVFAVVFSAGFGLLCMMQNGAHQSTGSAPPLIQHGSAMRNS